MDKRKDLLGYKVPDQYFDQLPDRIMQQIEAIHPRKRQLAVVRKGLAVAASIAAVAFVFWAIQNPMRTTLTRISNDEVYWYIQDNIDQFDLDWLSAIYPFTNPIDWLDKSEPAIDDIQLEELLDQFTIDEIEEIL